MKPAYAIPSVAEILAQESNGLKVVSTFSGAGGSCLGYRWAGYDVVWASEFIPAARDTYRANFPSAIVDERDIRTVTASDVLSATKLDVGEVDILEGSPPCASFSLAGKRTHHWGEVKKYSDTRQRTDDLFGEWTRLVNDLQPKVCVAENVPALATGKATGYFKQVIRDIEGFGYTVKAMEINAEWLGVPQRRKRLFIIGVRSDLQRLPVFPKPLRYRYSIRDAVPHMVGEIEHANGFHSIQRNRRKSHRPGHAWYSTNQPAATIQAQAPVRVRETTTRKITINELKRICGFPDDFKLTGTFGQQYERIGRAVCPPVARAIGATLHQEVLT